MANNISSSEEAPTATPVRCSDALLTRVRRLLHSDGIGYMPHERDSELVGFINDREVGVARHAIINLNEVRSVCLVAIDGRACLRRIRDRDTSRPSGVWSVDDGASEVHVR